MTEFSPICLPDLACISLSEYALRAYGAVRGFKEVQKLDSFARSANCCNHSLWPLEAASHLFVHLTLLGWTYKYKYKTLPTSVQ